MHNFEFRKKIVPLLTKDFSPKVFKDFSPKGNSIELSTFIKYGLTKVIKAPS